MEWFILIGAGLFEVAGVSTLNAFSHSQTQSKKILFLVATIALFFGALSSLGVAMQDIPMAMAYAIWTGIGAVGAVLVGVVFNGDKLGTQKIVSLLMIIGSTIALKVV